MVVTPYQTTRMNDTRHTYERHIWDIFLRLRHLKVTRCTYFCITQIRRYSHIFRHHTYLYILTHVHTYSCIAHIHRCPYIFTDVHTHLHMFIHIHRYSCITHIHTYWHRFLLHTYSYILTHLCITYTHTYSHTFLHHTYSYIYSHTFLYHTYSHIFIHFYTHFCIHIFIQPIADRVEQNLAIISDTFSRNQNSANGIYD